MTISCFLDNICKAAKQSGREESDIMCELRNLGLHGVDIYYKHFVANREAIVSWLACSELSVDGFYEIFDFPHEDAEIYRLRIDAFLTTAQELGVTKVLIVPGFLNENEREVGSEAYRRCLSGIVEGLKYAVTFAARLGITVMVENFGKPSAPYTTAEQLLYLLDNIPGLGYNLDTGNFLYSGLDTLSEYSALRSRIIAVHCKDRTFTSHPDETPDITADGHETYSCPAGSGVIPMPYILDDLRSRGYEGNISIEQYGSPDQYTYMKKALEWLKTYLNK